ncbi:hypothetical protein BD413DRAFT_72549 [Trametes elegans]|nr:hypothetical protein BD413DRAFT_72549 [Trametes elegans]
MRVDRFWHLFPRPYLTATARIRLARRLASGGSEPESPRLESLSRFRSSRATAEVRSDGWVLPLWPCSPSKSSVGFKVKLCSQPHNPMHELTFLIIPPSANLTRKVLHRPGAAHCSVWTWPILDANSGLVAAALHRRMHAGGGLRRTTGC